MTATVRDATFDVLRRLELTTIFSNPGSTEVPFLAGLPDDLHVRARAARGLGRLDGDRLRARPRRAGAGAAALDAGLGNAVAAIATARTNRAPLVVIVGQQDRRHLAQDPFLAGRLDGLAGEYPVHTDQPARAAGRPGRDRPRLPRGGHRPRPGARDRADGRLDRRRRPRRTRCSARSGCCARRPPTRPPSPRWRSCSTARAPAIVAGASADWDGAGRARRAAQLPGVPGAVRRRGGLPAGPPAVRRPPAGAARAAARDARAATTPCSSSAPARCASTRTTKARSWSPARGSRWSRRTPRRRTAARSTSPCSAIPAPSALALARGRRRPASGAAAAERPRAAAAGRAAARRPRPARARRAPAARRDPARGDAVAPSGTARRASRRRRRSGFISAMGMLGFALPAAIGLRMARPDRPGAWPSSATARRCTRSRRCGARPRTTSACCSSSCATAATRS